MSVNKALYPNGIKVYTEEAYSIKFSTISGNKKRKQNNSKMSYKLGKYICLQCGKFFWNNGGMEDDDCIHCNSHNTRHYDTYVHSQEYYDNVKRIYEDAHKKAIEDLETEHKNAVEARERAEQEIFLQLLFDFIKKSMQEEGTPPEHAVFDYAEKNKLDPNKCYKAYCEEISRQKRERDNKWI